MQGCKALRICAHESKPSRQVRIRMGGLVLIPVNAKATHCAPTSWSVGKMLSAKSSKSQCLGLLGVRWLAVLKTMGDSSNGRSNRMQIAIKQIRHLRRSSDCCASVNMLAPCCISGCCQAAMTTVSLPRLCNGQSTAGL